MKKSHRYAVYGFLVVNASAVAYFIISALSNPIYIEFLEFLG